MSIQLAKYITPSLRIGKLKELIHSERKNKPKQIQFDELLDKTSFFILGEPGYGKSRLVKELLSKHESQGKSCCFIDLKNLKSTSIRDIIYEKLETERKSNDILEPNIRYYFSENFKLENQSDNIIFLDALDEINDSDVIDLIKSIRELNDDFPSINIVISCRTNHLLKLRNEVSRFDFDYIVINNFQIWQVIEYIQQNCNAPEITALSKIELGNKIKDAHLIKYAHYTQQERTICIPRYLEMLVKLIEELGLDNCLSLGRCEIFDKFIDNRLRFETTRTKKYTNKIPYIKQSLERLALVMEIQRTNQLSKDDFVSFLYDTNQNLDSQVELEVFYARTILKDTYELIEFDNTEFQEYLAAKAIKRLGKLEQLVFDLAIESSIGGVYKNWFDVLSYLVELEPSLLLPLVNLGKRLRDEELFKLITYPKIDYFNKNEEQKAEVFDAIFYHYYNQDSWFDSMALTRYFVANEYNEKLLKIVHDEAKPDDSSAKGNVIRIMEHVFEMKVLNKEQIQKWQTVLSKRLELEFNPNTEYIHRDIIQTLGTISSIEELNEYKYLAYNSEGILDTLARVCSKIDPNNYYSIQLELDNFYRQGKIMKISSFLNKISSSDGFVILFQLLKNSYYKNHAYGKYSFDLRKYDSKEFEARLSNTWSKELRDVIFDFVIQVLNQHNHTRKDSFIMLIVKVLLDKEEGIFEELYNNVENNARNRVYFFSAILTYQDIPFISSRKEKMWGDIPVGFLVIRNSNLDDKEKLLHNYYPDTVARGNEQRKEIEAEESDRLAETKEYQDTFFQQFLECLIKKHEHIIKDYFDLSEEQKNSLLPTQIEQVKEVTLQLFQKNKVRDSIFEEGDNNGFTVSKFIGLYQFAVKIAIELNIDISDNRQEIVDYLTWCDRGEVKDIMKLIDEPRKIEIQELASWYLPKIKENKTLYRVGLHKFLDLCSSYNDMISTVSFLMDVVQEEGIDIHYKYQIIGILCNWQKIKEIEQIFEWNKSETIYADEYKSEYVPSYIIALEANKFLIQEERQDAILWRMNQIKKTPQEVKDISYRFIPELAVMPSESLVEPLQYVTSIKFKDLFLDLLSFAFDSLQEDKNYGRHANPIWGTVLEYFEKQITAKSSLQKYLEEIWEIASKFQPVPYMFQLRYNSLKTKYLEYLSEPQSFGDSIRTFNEIRSKKYLDIAYPIDLHNAIQDTINNDLWAWVNQGYYKFLSKLQNYEGGNVEREKIIQNTIVVQLENSLLKKGFRKSDFYREVEIVGGDKVDLVINYGAIGSVMIEVKLLYNAKSKKEDYRDNKFIPYLKQTNADFGIYLIFKAKEDSGDLVKAIKELKAVYTMPNVEVIGINCLKESKKTTQHIQ